MTALKLLQLLILAGGVYAVFLLLFAIVFTTTKGE